MDLRLSCEILPQFKKLQPLLAIEKISSGLFVDPTPLLEKESDSGYSALIFDVSDPLGYDA